MFTLIYITYTYVMYKHSNVCIINLFVLLILIIAMHVGYIFYQVYLGLGKNHMFLIHTFARNLGGGGIDRLREVF